MPLVVIKRDTAAHFLGSTQNVLQTHFFPCWESLPEKDETQNGFGFDDGAEKSMKPSLNAASADLQNAIKRWNEFEQWKKNDLEKIPNAIANGKPSENVSVKTGAFSSQPKRWCLTRFTIYSS